MTEEQERALRCVLEQLVVSQVSVNWAMEKIRGILKGEVVMKTGAKLPHEEIDVYTLNKNLKELENLIGKLGFMSKEVEHLTKKRGR